MKKTGIVVDNYKLEKFKKELTKNGFTEFTIQPFKGETSSIILNVEDKQGERDSENLPKA